MQIIEHVSWLYVENKKVLLTLSRGKTKWQLPGGKKDIGETDAEALIRECREELSIELVPESIDFVETIQGAAFGKEDTKVVINIFRSQFEGKLMASHEIEKISFCSFAEIPDTSELGWNYLKHLRNTGVIE